MNKTLFKIHRLLAFLVCVPLLLISLSGSVLVFKHEIDALLMPERVRVDFHGQQRLPFDVLLAAFNQRYPENEFTVWQVFADPCRAELGHVMAHCVTHGSPLFFYQSSASIL